jgi:hypothetical protein
MCKIIKHVVVVIWMLAVIVPGMGAQDPTLMGWWTFDDGSGTQPVDISNYGRHGEFVDSSEWVDEGHTGGALNFTLDSYVVIPGYQGVLGSSSRTCTAWIKTATAPGVIFGWALKVAGGKWIVRVNDGGQLRCEVHNGYHYGTTIVSDDQWHHVAVVLEDDGSPDVTETKLYVDGVLDATQDVADEPINTVAAMDVVMGFNPHESGRKYVGLIDEARIYDRALTQAEIQAVMEEAGQAFPFARGPAPEVGSIHKSTWANLSWKPGDFAVSHDLYMGETFGDVNDATHESETFRGNHTSAFLVVGFPGFPYPDGLVPGTTYYWRIDEVNEAHPDSPWKGEVWNFSIQPRTAYDPDPADGAEFVDPNNITLSWTPGYGAILHTVYLGSDYDEINNATGGAPLGSATYKLGPLELEKVYYWRVDEFDAVETHKGDIWSFTTPGAVGNPQPANGTADVQLNAILSWAPSDSAASHQLYFGMDKEAVRTADAGAPEYKGTRALDVESYDPGLLDAAMTYYWRVDEVDTQGNTAKGPLWLFTTGTFLLVDDFEGYTDDDTLGEAIWQTWIDGFGVADNGAQVGYLLPPYAEQAIVHGGSQSMPLLYVNEAGVTNSEATMTLTAPRDWTQAGVAELSLWFRGGSGNAAEPMYLSISNSAGAPAIVAHDDPDAATVGVWTSWRIPLQAFADQGINLSNVDKIALGLGSKGSAATGGSGTIFIDNIRLYQPEPQP